MGLWKTLTNLSNADGIREAMTRAYHRHRRHAAERGSPSPHEDGLSGALASRYVVSGISCSDTVLLSNLAPFFAMNESQGIEALAEYVVLQEMPSDARKQWLAECIRRVLLSMRDASLLRLVEAGISWDVAWVSLLSDAVRETVLSNAALSAQKTVEDEIDDDIDDDDLARRVLELDRGFQELIDRDPNSAMAEMCRRCRDQLNNPW